MKKSLLNQKGFSLVQVLIAGALAAGVAVVVAKLGMDSAKIQRGANISTEINQIVNMVDKLMLNNTACTNTLKQAGVLSVGGSAPINSIKDFSDPVGVGLDVYKTEVATTVKTITPNLLLSLINARRGGGVGVDPNPWPTNEIRLELTLDRKNEDEKRRSFGAKSIRKIFSINARFKDDEVIRCYSDLDNAVDEALKVSCVDVFGGVWDEPTSSCDTTAVSGLKNMREFHRTGNSSLVTPTVWDYCALTRTNGEDGWKDSTFRECIVTKRVDGRWQLRSRLDEGRSNRCSMICFEM